MLRLRESLARRALLFVVDEEERVVASVEQPGNDDRSADARARLMRDVLGLGAGRRGC